MQSWDADSERFEDWCSRVARHLELETCEIIFDVEESDLEEFLEGKGRYAPLAAMRGLRVSKSFEIEVTFISEDIFECGYIFEDGLETEYEEEEDQDDYDDEERSYAERSRRLCAKYKDMVRELLLPVTLRPRLSHSEEERYLSSRLKLLGTPEHSTGRDG
jgi:hypothetical protein